ncbi:conserved hypothetical protein [Alteromonas sp. 38]|uniref:transposase n=1 Tax=Alteromonas TaxID=226 RepID=UPI0012EF534A|nr:MULTISPECIES: transposase [Alteromonas]CAD5276177.1 conserved hypothetical protein [Alteromonas sp. 154]VXB68100.1 conserved hypothetical protein [Alteromonas sp. 38]
MNSRYPDSLKKLALKKVLELGLNASDVALELKISRSTIYSWLREERQSRRESKNKFVSGKLEEYIHDVSEERKTLIKALAILARELPK